MRSSEKVIIAIIVLSFLIGLFFYPYIPEVVASHWDAQGVVNGYMPKFWGVFLVPIISLGLVLLFLLIPKIDPLKANIEKFRKYFDWFIIIFLLFLLYVNMLTILWNLGARFNMVQLMIPAMGLLFFYMGLLLQKAKRNWFIGIRTPWTMSSDNVWDKTHKLGAKLFMLAGIIALLGILLPRIAIWLVLVPIILVSMYTIVYSYFVYKREKK
jgi:uncharacterized membrane protein